MNFASGQFAVFLPVVLLVYHRLLKTRRQKFTFLLLASWLFYACWNPRLLWVIVATTAIDYCAGLRIEASDSPAHRRAWLLVSIIANIGLLAFFKYTGFLSSNLFALAGQTPPHWMTHILLPIGISFHTFQGISYTVDVYRGRIKALHGFADFALFVAFFPQLVAGPIVRAVEFLPQMIEPPGVTQRQFEDGLFLIVTGLFKKIFIADRLATFVDPLFAHPSSFDSASLWWGILAYAGQIYCDFSGYSDIAIGAAKWFGFELPKNFHAPYTATSFSQFWAHWHITLSLWFRDYVFTPLGQRGPMWKVYRNLLFTMLLVGLWHGAGWNFILFGIYMGAMLVGQRIFRKFYRDRRRLRRFMETRLATLLCWGLTFFLLLQSYVLFRSTSLVNALAVYRGLFLVGSGMEHLYYTFVPLLLMLVALEQALAWSRTDPLRAPAIPAWGQALAYTSIVAMLVILAPGSVQPFIYFQF